MKAVVAAFNQEKALVGAFSVITNLRMELFQALVVTITHTVQVKELTSAPAQCTGDHVALYDGVDEYSELIGRWCGVGSFPVSIIGSSNKLFLEFVSTKHGPLLNTGQLCY